ncbi:hypothetical protein [Wenyingzhuangia sp. 2_MG-2023]|uniref:hypothetical protein n=1 Tax=Wenyingzhuangia sp. 2_MG-2023 TaxID=3062639 RepID=UPI0026E15DCA|nr:hypothetical protein [Wenyingzhuangia sp. 2_MG-2023]MDO6737064.1 hypothetical protein [Wenyingzhuangia sp. 2_MG-2023]
MKYFKECNTLDEAKNKFKILCFELHPDTSGGNTQQQFIAMFKEFKIVSKTLKNNSTNEAEQNFDSDKFYNLIKKFDGLENIKISFVGSFIWLEDIEPFAMYQQKDIIKSIKIEDYNPPRWARAKKSWYFSPQDYKSKGRSRKNLDELKSVFGSQSYKTKSKIRLTA